jgi:phospholipid transport system substrate-binding protein
MNERSGNFLIPWVLALGFLLSWTAWAEGSADPKVLIQETSDELKALVRNERERLRQDPGYVQRMADEIVGSRVDFSRVSSLVLGKYWARATPEQRAAFSREFKRLLVRTYATTFLDFEDWEIRFLPMPPETRGSDVTVRTEVMHPAGPPVSVLYRLRRGEGGWKAYDVVIEGVSLVTNYRSSFAREVRRHGMDGLIRRIAELNDRREGAGDPETQAGGSEESSV